MSVIVYCHTTVISTDVYLKSYLFIYCTDFMNEKVSKYYSTYTSK